METVMQGTLNYLLNFQKKKTLLGKLLYLEKRGLPPWSEMEKFGSPMQRKMVLKCGLYNWIGKQESS